MSTRLDLTKTRFSSACLAKHGAPTSWEYVGISEIASDEAGVDLIETWTDAHGAPFELQTFFMVGPVAAAALDCEPRLTLDEVGRVPEDCVRCGTCCTSIRTRYVQVTEARYEQMSEAARSLVALLDPGEEIDPEAVRPGSAPPIGYMKMTKTDLCAALSLDAAKGELICTIYAERPDVCRDLQQGGSGCRAHLFSKRRLPMFALADAKRAG